MRAGTWVVIVVTGALVLGVGLASAAPPQRLNKAQWARYQTSLKTYNAQTATTVARFRKCRSSTAYTSYARAFAKCLGTAPVKEISVTQALFNTLGTFKTGGACGSSRSAYQGALFFWKAAVSGVNKAVHSNIGSMTNVISQTDNAVTAANKVTVDAKLFEKACKPR